MAKRRRKGSVAVVVALLALLGALFVPEGDAAIAAPGGRAPFTWGEDALFDRLERDYDRARAEGCDALGARIEEGLASVERRTVELASRARAPDDPAFDTLDRALFDVAPLVAACPSEAPRFAEEAGRLRLAVKEQSTSWDMGSRPARETLYRSLYGARAALEEILLQAPEGTLPALLHGVDERSYTPSVVVRGVTLHSGDVLLSRGGAPTSAFIARGNDFPGNFSHVALLHVAEDGTPAVIESHIERGVVTSTAHEYLEDTKLRIMVLRLRADHPALRGHADLPHRAAGDALAMAETAHIPYDFAMDWRDPSKQFCSEVAFAAYARHQVRLWRGLSSMSGEGLTRWLGAFGVRHFRTLAPSDLEYDPQLRVVAEWRDPETLFSDHLDNAVLDAMLEGAEAGDTVDYSYPKLPIARILKAYSLIRNAMGDEGPIPEGMSATTGLRVDWLRNRHAAIRAGLERRAAAYQREHHRRPPYWTLVRLAREAKREAD